MKKTSPQEVSAQGADSSTPIPDVDTIKGWLKDDLGRSISCLTAIHTDAELLNAMAEFMQGRIINHRNLQEIAKSQEVAN